MNTLYITRYSCYTLYSYGSLIVHHFDSVVYAPDDEANFYTGRLVSPTVDWNKVHRKDWTDQDKSAVHQMNSTV